MGGQLLIFSLLLITGPFSCKWVDSEVDVLEINTVYSVTRDEGLIGNPWVARAYLKQTIGWRLESDGTWHCDWWVRGHFWPCGYTEGKHVVYIPYPHGYWRVLARRVTETHTTYDPEIEDRNFFPVSSRGGLDPMCRLSRIKDERAYVDEPQ